MKTVKAFAKFGKHIPEDFDVKDIRAVIYKHGCELEIDYENARRDNK